MRPRRRSPARALREKRAPETESSPLRRRAGFGGARSVDSTRLDAGRRPVKAQVPAHGCRAASDERLVAEAIARAAPTARRKESSAMAGGAPPRAERLGWCRRGAARLGAAGHRYQASATVIAARQGVDDALSNQRPLGRCLGFLVLRSLMRAIRLLSSADTPDGGMVGARWCACRRGSTPNSRITSANGSA